MSVEHVEVLVEEASMEALLRVLLPRLAGPLSFDVYQHQGKHNLLKRLPGRLRGYASWLPPSWRIIVVVDRDEDDCSRLKADLEGFAVEAGLATRTSAAGGPYAVVNRLAIEELEAWYFGDWAAVRAAYPDVRANIPRQARYRLPDAIAGGTWENFERILKRSGYFTSGLRKIEAARTISAHLDREANRSQSFQALRTAILEIAAEAGQLQ